MTDRYQPFVDSLISILANRSQYLALAVGGSWKDKQLDQFSDIDLILVHQGPDMPLATRQELAQSVGNLLVSFTGEHVGEPRLLICLYDKPLLHVDLKFVALADMDRRVEEPLVLWERDHLLSSLMKGSQADFPYPDYQWIEDRFWVWVHYAATKIGRGELYETLAFFSFMQQTVLGPLALIKNGHLPKGVRKLEMLLPEADRKAMHATLGSYDRASCLKALQHMVGYYRSLRTTLMPSSIQQHPLAEARVSAYLDSLASPQRYDY
jgi:hypothetical protein